VYVSPQQQSQPSKPTTTCDVFGRFNICRSDEDEGLATSTNDWTYPDVTLAGRKVKTFLRQMFND